MMVGKRKGIRILGGWKSELQSENVDGFRTFGNSVYALALLHFFLLNELLHLFIVGFTPMDGSVCKSL